ncbi:hypothetical protein Y032_0038g3656 [Ancylostoma ceylanicum]|uniref:Uncharacterized protein n=1 Tax=Ancylostoma ceylanicum TaxID=53326 RepID=A0A016UIG1_9BILA|nr:hypothetical protein Y032_0038g3656 [Ancylostoma ceylanicum]
MVSEVNADSDEDMDEDNRKPGLVAISSDEDEAREEEDVFSKIRRVSEEIKEMEQVLKEFPYRTIVLIRDVTLCCAVCHRCYLPRLP